MNTERINPEKPQSHPDVEFYIHPVDEMEGKTRIFLTLDQAAAHAFLLSLQVGDAVTIDVCCSSEAGASWWSGYAGVLAYRNNPGASVFDRIHMHIEQTGPVA